MRGSLGVSRVMSMVAWWDGRGLRTGGERPAGCEEVVSEEVVLLALADH